MQKYKKYLTNKSLFFLYGFISLLFKLSVIFTPIITGKVIDNAIAKDMNTLKINAFYMLTSISIFLILMYIRSYLNTVLYCDIQYGLKKELFEKIIYSDYQDIKKHDLGYYLQRHNSDVDDMSFMFFEYKIDSIINLVYFIILFVSIFVINFKVSLIMIIIVPIFILANKKLIPKIEVKTRDFINSEENLNSEFEASFNNSHAIRTLRMQDVIFKEYLTKNKIGQKAMLSYSLSDERYNTFIVSGLLNLCNCLVYIFGACLALKGEISIGQLTTVNIFVSRIWDPVEYFLGLKKRISKAKISEKRVFDLLNKETIHLKQTETASFSEICFSNINFGFAEKTLFDNFRLDFKSSTVYLINGKNGSGKTTLFNILSGLYFDDTYKIQVDGKRIDDKANFLYNNVYYIPSENYIFKGTIKDNLKSFDVCPIENHSLDDDVKSLSSGETKKLQLLQSVNRKEEIIIYDEPLNYLDKSKYQDFYDIVNANKDAGHIILIASHEKIKDVDYISIDI